MQELAYSVRGFLTVRGSSLRVALSGSLALHVDKDSGLLPGTSSSTSPLSAAWCSVSACGPGRLGPKHVLELGLLPGVEEPGRGPYRPLLVISTGLPGWNP